VGPIAVSSGSYLLHIDLIVSVSTFKWRETLPTKVTITIAAMHVAAATISLKTGIKSV